MPPQPMEAPFGAYEVYERLGMGGMATVHRAKKLGPEGFERPVALKRMLAHLAEDASFVESFIREAKVASLLAHPAIAQTYDFGRIGGVYYIAMELVAGFDVRKLLYFASKANEAIPLPVVLAIVREMCEALDYAHNFVDEHGTPLHIVHRDVSPSNLIVSGTGHLKVIDFGIAKASARQLHTESGKVKGKLGYMSPEAIRGEPIGPASDVFSAGVVAWELLTLSPLFSKRTDFETMQRIREGAIIPPSHHNPDVPEELDAIVLAALDRAPDRRPTAGQLRHMLEAFAARAGLHPSPRLVAEWMRRYAGPDDAWARASLGGPVRATTAGGASGPRLASGRGEPGFHGAPTPARPPHFEGDDATSNLRGPKLRRSAEHVALAAEVWDLPGSPAPAGPDFTAADMRRSVPSPTEPPPHGPDPMLAVMPPPPPRRSSRAPVVVLFVLAMVAAALGAYLVIKPASQPAPLVASGSAAPGSGELASVHFEIQPAGAIVEVAGRPLDPRSPRDAQLPPGRHEVTVRQDGHKPYTTILEVRDGDRQTIHVSLQRERARLVVESEPPGLAIELDGQPTGERTPATLETTPGPHRVAIAGAAGERWSEDVTALADGEHALRATFTKAPEREPERPDRPARPKLATATPKPDKQPEPVEPPDPKPDPTPVDQPRPPDVVPEPVKPEQVKPKPPARTPVVAASAVSKLAGELPVMRVKNAASDNGDVTAKMCIDETGRVSSVKLLKAMPELVADLQRALGTWRYKPYVNRDGKPSPACFVLSLRVVIKRS